MKRALVILIFILAFPDSVDEQFRRGYEAYQQGDYETAFKEWRPLAEQGHTGSQFGLGSMSHLLESSFWG